MEAQPGSIPLTRLLSALGDEARAVTTLAELGSSYISSARIWIPGEELSSVNQLLVVPVPVATPESVTEILKHPTPLSLALCGPLGPGLSEDTFSTSRHAIIRIPRLEAAGSAISVIAELSDPNREVELRKLTSLQRSFSQALSHKTPISALLQRLHRQTNAVCLVVDASGRVHESTGTIPLSLLLEQVRKTNAEAQRVSDSGWEGLAIRLSLSGETSTAEAGWLLTAARRPGFPDAQSSAAAHIVATLIESARHAQVTARAQEEAIRAAVFDEALGLDPKPNAADLTSRLAALGFSLDTPLRVLAVSSTHPELMSKSAQQGMQRATELALEHSDISYLVTTRGDTTAFLVQAEVSSISRALRERHKDAPEQVTGIGREVAVITDIAESLSDALIAIRTVRAGAHDSALMSYDEFDFATRVFSSIGLDRMSEYAHEFLAPLLDREPILEALKTYFRLSQNTSATADFLGIHHNTLRYRLSKIEELLAIDLNSPAAISSLFFATTALDLVMLGTTKHHTSSDLIPGQEATLTWTGISAQGASRSPSASITRSRPPLPKAY